VGNVLLVGSCSGNFYALDRRTGQVRWTYNVRQDGDQTSFHGDPLVTDNLILIGTDNGKQGHLYAFERESGKVRWKTLAPAGAEGNVGAATDIVRRGNQIYAVAQGDELLCVSLEDGNIRWTFASQYDRHKNLLTHSPALVGELVLFAGLDGILYALQADSGQIVWKADLHSRLTTSPIVSPNGIYVGTQDGHVYCLQTKNGAITRSLAADVPPDLHIAVTADSVFAVMAHAPQTEGGISFQQTDLEALDLDLHRVRWRQKTPAVVPRNTWTSSRPYLWKEYIVVGDLAGKLFAFQQKDGSLIWSQQFPSRVVRGVGFSNDLLYLGMQGGMIYALDSPF
jgi:outer membrane protein assembly factor BamB